MKVSDGSFDFLFFIISLATSSEYVFKTVSLAATIELSENSSKIHKAV